MSVTVFVHFACLPVGGFRLLCVEVCIKLRKHSFAFLRRCNPLLSHQYACLINADQTTRNLNRNFKIHQFQTSKRRFGTLIWRAVNFKDEIVLSEERLVAASGRERLPGFLGLVGGQSYFASIIMCGDLS